jgi:hypothetical protein
MLFEPYISHSVEKNEMVIDGEWAMTLKDAVLKCCSNTVRLETRKSLSVDKALSSYEDMLWNTVTRNLNLFNLLKPTGYVMQQV